MDQSYRTLAALDPTLAEPAQRFLDLDESCLHQLRDVRTSAGLAVTDMEKAAKDVVTRNVAELSDSAAALLLAAQQFTVGKLL